MNWQTLLSAQRLGKVVSKHEQFRSPYQKDLDRITFSSSFRRLQDKTQVFPLAQNDYVRTRLTHSLEVSCVGRSIAAQVGAEVIKKYALPNVTPGDFSDIVAASCLAHDIGNPPFGHFGEEAIRAFFAENPVGMSMCDDMSEDERKDLLNFEGNAQGFRIITKLQNPQANGGLQLTFASLGAFIKYPCTAKHMNKSHIRSKKNGVFIDDLAHFRHIAETLGLRQFDQDCYARHPLTYLMEAADDICYGIIDIEDAYQVKQIDYDSAYGLLKPLAGEIDDAYFARINSRSDELSYLRAKAIGNLIQQCVTVFMRNETVILTGECQRAIADMIPAKAELRALTKFAAANIYGCPAVVKTEIAGYKILGDLLELFCDAVNDYAKSPRPKPLSEMVLNLIPPRFLDAETKLPSDSAYQRALGLCDYISGMTDSYAVSLHRQLKGYTIE